MTDRRFNYWLVDRMTYYASVTKDRNHLLGRNNVISFLIMNIEHDGHLVPEPVYRMIREKYRVHNTESPSLEGPALRRFHSEYFDVLPELVDLLDKHWIGERP